MNTRMYELAQQAGFSTWELNPSKETMSDTPERLNKFAELIVKECCDAADMYVGVTGHIGDCIGEYMGYGEEHGVVEWRAK